MCSLGNERMCLGMSCLTGSPQLIKDLASEPNRYADLIGETVEDARTIYALRWQIDWRSKD